MPAFSPDTWDWPMSRRLRRLWQFLVVLALTSHVTAPFAHGTAAHLPFPFGHDYCGAGPAPGSTDPAPASGTRPQCPVCAAFKLGDKLVPPSLPVEAAPIVLAVAEIFPSLEAPARAFERGRLPPAQAPPTTA